MQCCEQCAKLIIDVDALRNGMVADKCAEFNYHVYCPFLSGWNCPRYQSKNRDRGPSLWEKLKKKIFERIK